MILVRTSYKIISIIIEHDFLKLLAKLCRFCVPCFGRWHMLPGMPPPTFCFKYRSFRLLAKTGLVLVVAYRNTNIVWITSHHCVTDILLKWR